MFYWERVEAVVNPEKIEKAMMNVWIAEESVAENMMVKVGKRMSFEAKM